MIIMPSWVERKLKSSQTAVERAWLDGVEKYNILSKSLPKLSANRLDWIEQARPVVDGRPRNFLASPMWEDVYLDNHGFMMILAGRQVYKSTYCTDELACMATSKAGVQACYVTHSMSSLTTFSTQRLRVGTFLQNAILAQFPRRDIGGLGEVSMKNNSTIYMTTDNHEYRKVEGKSLDLTMLDEAQYHAIEHLPRVREAMTSTKGKLKILGIGGEAGSAYERLWADTDQREWVYDDPLWREKLQFDEKGLVIGEYMKNALKGKWIPQKPENYLHHGYHMPQTIFAMIPISMDDAIEKYHVDPEYSLEWKQRHYSNAVWNMHVLGTFYKAQRRPVTREMVFACMTPYRNISLNTPEEIAELKDIFGNEIRVSLGVDFGSGPSNSLTVISIMIHWRKSDRYHLAFIERRPAEHQLDQAKYITEVFKRAKCDIGVGDLGYGQIQVKVIQDGGADRTTGEVFSGVGNTMFIGCKSIGNETKPVMKYDIKVDEHGEEAGRFTIDKATAIQGFIDLLEVYRRHPIYSSGKNQVPKLMIPYHKDKEWETDWLVTDFTDITRKDLVEASEEAEHLIDKRTRARKEFNHPKDSTMSVIYAKLGIEQEREWSWVSA